MIFIFLLNLTFQALAQNYPYFSIVNLNDKDCLSDSILMEIDPNPIASEGKGRILYRGCQKYNSNISSLNYIPLEANGDFFMSNPSCLAKGNVNFKNNTFILKEFYDLSKQSYCLQSGVGEIEKLWANEPLNPVWQKINIIYKPSEPYIESKSELKFNIDFDVIKKQFVLNVDKSTHLGKKLFDSLLWTEPSNYHYLSPGNLVTVKIFKDNELRDYRQETLEIYFTGRIKNNVLILNSLEINNDPEKKFLRFKSVGPAQLY